MVEWKKWAHCMASKISWFNSHGLLLRLYKGPGALHFWIRLENGIICAVEGIILQMCDIALQALKYLMRIIWVG
jgi:hypothetical protein